MWCTLGGDSVPPKYLFHGTPKYVWDDTEDSWQFGFDASLSNEKYSQLTRGRSVYFSNSLAHALYYGAYRSGTFAFNAPFCSIEAVVIAVEIDLKKMVNIQRKAGFAVLESGDRLEKFIQMNKDSSLHLPRLTPPWKLDTAYSCGCVAFGKAKSCCRYHFLMVPFRAKDSKKLKESCFRGCFGGVAIDELRQVCSATKESVDLMNSFPAVAIHYTRNLCDS